MLVQTLFKEGFRFRDEGSGYTKQEFCGGPVDASGVRIDSAVLAGNLNDKTFGGGRGGGGGFGDLWQLL